MQHRGQDGVAPDSSPQRHKVDSLTDISLSTANVTDPSVSRELSYLHEKLRSEANSRQEVSDLYDHLQQEYEDLLVKHAQAENTIDHLRIGARLTLYEETVPAKESQGKQSDRLPAAITAVTSSNKMESKNVSIGVGVGAEGNHDQGGITASDRVDPLMNSQTMAEGNRMGVMFQIQSLQEDVDMLEAHFNESERDFSQSELQEIQELLDDLKAQHRSLSSEVQTSGDRR